MIKKLSIFALLMAFGTLTACKQLDDAKKLIKAGEKVAEELSAPTPSANADDAETNLPSAGKNTVATSGDAIKKQNSFIDAYNAMTNFSQQYDSYKKNAKAFEKGKKITSYSVPSNHATTSLERLNKAFEQKVSIPELDDSAQALAETLEPLATTLKKMRDYSDTKGYLADNGDLARELHPLFTNQAEAFLTAHNNFGNAIEKYRIVQDDARLSSLKPGTAAHASLAASIAARNTANAVSNLDLKDKNTLETLIASVDELAEAADMLAEIFDSPAGEAEIKKNVASGSFCQRYKDAMKKLVGQGRAVAEAAKTKKAVSGKINDFVRSYNSMISDSNNCKL